jgi:hypothetical protein
MAPGLSGSARRTETCNSKAERFRREKRRGTALTVPPFAPSRLGRSAGALTCSARSPSTARCFSAFSSGDPRLFAGEFVRRSFLVRRASTFRRDRALCLRVHRRKSAWCLADVAHTTRFCPTVVAPARSDASAPLVHPVVLVVTLVCHYRSPAAIFEFNDAATGRTPASGGSVERNGRLPDTLMRKRQAVISKEGRNPVTKVGLWISSLLARL